MGRDEPDDRRGRDRESRPDSGGGRRDGGGSGGSSSSRYGEPPSRGGGDRHMAEADRLDRGRSNGGGSSSRNDGTRPREREVAATDRQARGDRDSDKPRDKERDRKRDKEREERNALKEAMREKEKARWVCFAIASTLHMQHLRLHQYQCCGMP